MARVGFRKRIEKSITFLLVLFYYVGGYYLISFWASGRPHFYTVALPFEERIPFVPCSMFGYLLIYISAALMYLAVDDVKYVRKMALALAVGTTFHFAFFILFPVHYNLRPDLGDPVSPLLQFIQYYYFIDLPYNCFPSLHVSSSFIAALFLGQYDKRLGYLLIPTGILIAISVVLVKQHYILDAIAGLLISLFIYWVFFHCNTVVKLVDRIVAKGIVFRKE